MPQDPMDFEWSYWIEWGRERILWLLAGHLLVSQISRLLVEKVCRDFLHSRDFVMGLFTVDMGSFAVRPLSVLNPILWCELCVGVGCLNVRRLWSPASKSLCLVVKQHCLTYTPKKGAVIPLWGKYVKWWLLGFWHDCKMIVWLWAMIYVWCHTC